MKIERTYMFNKDKYAEVVGNYNYSECNFELLYDYISIEGIEWHITIAINMHKKKTTTLLLGNDVSSMVNNDMPFATIIFDNQNEFSNFVMPEWLGEFEYVE